MQLVDLRRGRQQQKHEHVDAFLVHELSGELFNIHHLPYRFANLMFGPVLNFLCRYLVELLAQMLAEAPEHWLVKGVLLDSSVVNPDSFFVWGLLVLLDKERAWALRQPDSRNWSVRDRSIFLV